MTTADDAVQRASPDRARFVVVTDSPKTGWAEALRASLKNPNPFAVKVVGGLAGAVEGIDEALKAAGAVDEVILHVGAAEAGKDAEGLRRDVEKLVYRVVLYQPDGREPARVTLCVAAEGLAAVYREVALGLETRFVDLVGAADDGAIAERVAAVFAAGAAPTPPADVKVAGRRVTWTASASKGVIGYLVRDTDEEGTILTTSTNTEATLPEGHDACVVIARDGAGRVSKGAVGGG